jgi:hypothetical protein
MYSNGEGLGTPIGKSLKEKSWDKWDDRKNNVIGKKRFVCCICPRCRKMTHVYMLWSGRGVPRKYCPDCRAIINAYDESAMYESHHTVLASGKKSRRSVSEE